MRTENRLPNEEYAVSSNPIGWAVVGFKQRTRGGKITLKLAWVNMRYQRFLRGRRGLLARPSGVIYYLWQPNRSEKLGAHALQYWQGVPEHVDPDYDPKNFPIDPEESRRAIQSLKDMHKQLKERLQTREGKMSDETRELAKRFLEAQEELVLDIEQGKGIGDPETAAEYARMLNAYGIAVVDSLVHGLPADELAMRLFGYDRGDGDLVPSIFGNYLANSGMHHHAIDQLIATGDTDVPLVMTETMRGAEGHLLLQGLAALIDRVQNGEKLDEDLKKHVCDTLGEIAVSPDLGVEGYFVDFPREFIYYAEEFRFLLQGRGGHPPAVIPRTVDCGDGRVYTYYDWNIDFDDKNNMVGHPAVANFFEYNNYYSRGAFMASGAGNAVGDPLGGLFVQAAMARHLLECGKVADNEPEDAKERAAYDLDAAVILTIGELAPLFDEVNAEASEPPGRRRYTNFLMFRPAQPHVLSRLANITAALKFAQQHGLQLNEAPKRLQKFIRDYGLDNPDSHLGRTIRAMFALSGKTSPMMFKKGYTLAEEVGGGPDEPHWVYARDESVQEWDDHLRVWDEFVRASGGRGGSAS